MGIPKFFRWLSERYPLLSQPIGINGAPPVDNLYLDMNGIIHSCTHGNDPCVKLTEEDMVLRIFNYLDKLFHIVKPQKLLFMAVDGCAPRAKMNQQRARRFRSAQEQEEARKAAERKGEPLPKDAFDSNCITPGTTFMHRLSKHIRFFIRKKIETDPLWQVPMVIFSGHDVPGEGEHKIMEFIRWSMREPNYQPNMRHCMYGLDADLIMLSLVTHEPHFVLLREVVQFGGKSSGQPAREIYDNPCADHFILLHIGLLRDYLELEFAPLKSQLDFEFDLERIIDDFVLLGMLVGNDFLPALPTLDIAEGALNHLFVTYKELLPRLGGYITLAGQLHRARLQMVLKALGENELEVLEERARDTEEFESRKRSRNKRDEAPFEALAEADGEDMDVAMAALAVGSVDPEGWKVVGARAAPPLGELEIAEDAAPGAKLTGATMMSEENRRLMMSGQGEVALRAWKTAYYRKAGASSSREEMVSAYVHGLHWVLEYYYRGVASWNWYYPFHYAPCASDIVDIESIQVNFKLGKPFLPFQQLLGVLPAASCKHLPKPYHWLFTDPKSPILDFYPQDFECDFEGKRADYEAVILINFVDEERLLKADALVTGLSKTEEEANKLGPFLVFRHDPSSTDKTFCASTMPDRMARVETCNSRCINKYPPPPLPKGQPGFVPKLRAGTRTGEKGGIPGYPSLKTLKATTRLDRVGVQVFNQASKRESLVLVCNPPEPDLRPHSLAQLIVGQRFYVDWPFLKEAQVTAVSDAKCKVSMSGAQQHDGPEASRWTTAAAVMTNNLLKKGIDIQRCSLVLHLRELEGLTVQVDGTIEKRFSKEEVVHPLQVTLRRHPAPDPRVEPEAVAEARQESLANLKPGDRALFLGAKYYGSVATILEPTKAGLDHKGHKILDNETGTLRLSIDMSGLPPSAAAAAKRILGGVNTTFIPSFQACRQAKLSSRALGCMAGNLWVKTGEGRDDRVDIGLAVKNGAKGLCVPEFCRPAHSGMGWMYSAAFIEVLHEYNRRFPWVSRMLHESPEARDYDVKDIFPDQAPGAQVAQVNEVRNWLKSLPAANRPLVRVTTQVAPEAAVRSIQAATPPPSVKTPKPVELEGVSPKLLLPPMSKFDPLMELAGGTFELGDRVAFTGCGEGPPFGSQGCVVGIIDDAVEVLFDTDIPNGSNLHGRCIGKCGGVFLAGMLLNISKPPTFTKSANAAAASTNGILDQKPLKVPKPPALDSPAKPQDLSPACVLTSGKRAVTPEMRGQRVPKMPEQSENGGRGFTIGRGKGLPPPAASANGLAASNGGQRALGVLPPAAQATQDGAPPLEARLMHWQTAGTQLLQELQRLSPNHAALEPLASTLGALREAMAAASVGNSPQPPAIAPPEGCKTFLQQLQGGSASNASPMRVTLEDVEAKMMAGLATSPPQSGGGAHLGANLLSQLRAAAAMPPNATPQGRDSSAAATATLQGLLGIKGQISPSQTPVPNLRSHSQGKGRAGEDATQQEPKEARQAGKQAEASPMGAGGLSAIWEKLRAQTQLPAGSDAPPSSSSLPPVPPTASHASMIEASYAAAPPPPPSASLLNPMHPSKDEAAKQEEAAKFWASLQAAAK